MRVFLRVYVCVCVCVREREITITFVPPPLLELTSHYDSAHALTFVMHAGVQNPVRAYLEQPGARFDAEDHRQ